MKIVAFIPIKLNNERLPGKNLLPLAGKPLCQYMFETIERIDEIDEKYVFCSDEAIVPYIPDGLTFYKRNPYFDGSQIKGLEIIRGFVTAVDADIYVLAHVTAPFTKAESLRTALNMVISEGYDSAFSAVEVKDYLWKNDRPLNFDGKNIVRTQDLEPVYMETSGFHIFRKEVFTEQGKRIGNRPYICTVSTFEGVDIDMPEDYEFAKLVAEHLGKKGASEERT